MYVKQSRSPNKSVHFFQLQKDAKNSWDYSERSVQESVNSFFYLVRNYIVAYATQRIRQQ